MGSWLSPNITPNARLGPNFCRDGVKKRQEKNMRRHNRSLYRPSQAGRVRAWGGGNSSEGRHKKGSKLNAPATEENEPVESNAELKKKIMREKTTLEKTALATGERAMLENGQWGYLHENAATKVGTDWWSTGAITTAISFEGEVEWARSNCWNAHGIPRKWRSRKQVRRPVVEHRTRRRHTETLEEENHRRTGQHTRIGNNVGDSKMPPILPRKNTKKSPGNAKEHGQMVSLKKSRKNAEENTKTLQKTDQVAPNTRHSKTPTTCNSTRIHYNHNRWPGLPGNCSAPGQQR